MAKYILRRFIYMLGVILITIVIIFTLMYFAPGDPARSIIGETASNQAVEELRATMGLDDPYHIRLVRYVGGLLQGDFGTSYRSKSPVLDEILYRYPNTLKLTFGSVLLGMLIGVSAGVYSAVKQYSVWDRIFTSFSLFGASAPSFWIAMILVLVFSINLGWVPATGSYSLKHWILPVFTMGLQCSATIMRMTRTSMLEVIRQDYIRTARAKGQSEFKIIVSHALRNALIPILTISGLLICGFIGGSVLVETVFALPGVGKYTLDSVAFRDFPAVQGCVLWICINCIVVTFIVDMLYAVIDPRIKTMYGSKIFSRSKRKKVSI